MTARAQDLARISVALDAARLTLRPFTPGAVEFQLKAADNPVTAADRAVNEVLHAALVRDDEAWLSEETVDDPTRLERRRVWVVDPLDGTKEFVQGIPEWCVSIGLVEDGEPVAGGICNPATGEVFLGACGVGVTRNGVPARVSGRAVLAGARVLASRSEVGRGEWERFRGTEFGVRPMGSVAYKLALVAAGLADVTWTLVPKHEWDVAAGVALLLAAGGEARTLEGGHPVFNRRNPKLTGLIAAGPALMPELLAALGVGTAPSA